MIYEWGLKMAQTAFNSLFILWVLKCYFNFFNLYVRLSEGSSASQVMIKNRSMERNGSVSNVDLLVSVD